jgi:colanic acid/amylovoran biosynthesis protein
MGRRIFVIPGTFSGANLGDLAMFQVAIERLQHLWLDASFAVLAQSSDLVEGLGNAHIVSTRSWSRWIARQRGSWMSLLPHRLAASRSFSKTLLSSDLVLMAGSGILTDAFHATGRRILTILDAANRRGIPTVIAGQGIGPVENPEFLAQASSVLSHVNSIFVRESQFTPAFLARLNVRPERIVVTGDDAIELAARETPSSPGTDIGVNLRVADYASIELDVVATVHTILQRQARQFKCGLIGIPISRNSHDADLRTAKSLAPEDHDLERMPWTTRAVIRRVSKCRMVVAGSYHAGVFALSQGIPVVAIVKSNYYEKKFQGLAAQFGVGCTVLNSSETNFAARLEIACLAAWKSAESLNPILRTAAARQIEAGRKAYASIPGLLS